MHCAEPGDYHWLSLARIQSHSPAVIPLTHYVEITIHGFCNCYSIKGDAPQQPKWSHQRNHKDYSLAYRKASRCTGGRTECPKHCKEALLHNVNQPSTTTYCDRLESVSKQTAQNLKCPQNRAWREFLMIDPAESCTEVDLHNPSLLPALSNALCKMWEKHRMTK